MSELLTPGLTPLSRHETRHEKSSQTSRTNTGRNSEPTLSSAYIVDATPDNLNELVANSESVPVLLSFWAEWCESCKALAPILSQLAENYQGAFVLAKVDADQHPMVAQQLGVRGLPTLKLIKSGQIVDELTGAQSEGAVNQLLAKHIEAPVGQSSDEDALILQVERAMQMRAYPEALVALKKAIDEAPERYVYQKLLAFVLIAQEDLQGAQAVIDHIPDGEPDKKAAAAKLWFAQELQALPPLSEQDCLLGPQKAEAEWAHLLAGATQSGSFNNKKQALADVLYHFGILKVLEGDCLSGIEIFFRLFAEFPKYREATCKQCLLKIFDLLGKSASLSKQYQRKMFALLH